MPTPIRTAAIVAAVLVVLIAGVAIVRPSLSPVATSPTAAPVASPSATSVPTVGPSPTYNLFGACGEPMSACRGSLDPGMYTSVVFVPRLTYTVPDGWYNKFDQSRGYGLMPDSAENRASLDGTSFGRTWIELQRDLAVTRADCRELPEPDIGRTASDVVAALSARDGLVVSERALVEVGGLRGFTIDLRLEEGWTGVCPQSEDPVVPLLIDPFASPGTGLHWGAIAGERYRLTFLDLPEGGTVLVAVYSATETGWDEYLAAAEAVIDTFEFGQS